ncbi:MAG TPA: sulfotransferase [Pirellulaceae bacterium]|nr:sulfotransferase [Pirellulaceae bacterium]
MRFGPYARLLFRHRFGIHPFKYPMTGLVGVCTVVNSVISLGQRALFDRRIQRTELHSPPLFIVGHWRSGTTLLHELISLDTERAYPSNFDAFVPHHMLVSRWFLKGLVNLLLPARRPMDNMTLAAHSPQEDDFALVSLGAPTPYLDIAFPNDRFRDRMTFDFDHLSKDQQQGLRDGLSYFLRTLTLRYRKPLVLKSPPHTARIGHLARWFPGAKFIHIARHPNALVESTKRLWRALDHTQGYQLPNYSDDRLETFIHECCGELYNAYQRQRPTLAPHQIAEIRFEDLLADPQGTLAGAYETLQLDGLDRLLPAVRQYFERNGNHRPATRIKDAEPPLPHPNWSIYATAFGYSIKKKGDSINVENDRLPLFASDKAVHR